MGNTLKYKVIKNLEQYKEYCDRHEALMLDDEEQYADEIELLELLIENYDQRLIHARSEVLNPVELLRALLGDANMTQSELSKAINVSKQLISDVLAYRRNISKDMVYKLAAFFSMSPEAFSRPYELST